LTSLLFTPAQHEEAARLASAAIGRYHEALEAMPVFPAIDRTALRALMQAPLPDAGTPLDALFAELETILIPNSTQLAHPRFLSYVSPSPNGVSPYAEAISAALNQNSGLWTLSPAANAVEQTVMGWFGQLFGFGPGVGGIITSGGSMANQVGLTAARDRALGADAQAKGLQGGNAPLTLYASTEVHASIDKAVSMLGLGTQSLRKIPADSAFRLPLAPLAAAVAADRAAGFRPFCVVASAGTVTTGAVDPLAELAAFCRTEGLWLHVDGAYGALAALSPRFEPMMAGIGLADSVSLDPHKFLFVAMEAGCVLVRDPADLRHSFSIASSYLAKQEDADFIHYTDHGPQLSRRFNALKIWWSLRHFGRALYAETIDRMADLAAHMGGIAAQNPRFELLAPVTFNCVCFRMAGLDDAANRAVLKRLVDSGIAFLGPALVQGRVGMRACFMNLRTTRADVDLIMQSLATLAESQRNIP